VDALLSPFSGGAGGDSCITSGLTDTDFSRPSVGSGLGHDPVKATAEETAIGQPWWICFYRFQAGSTLELTVRSPTGTTQSYTVCYNCTKDRPTSLMWYTVAGQPLGRYRLLARQGRMSAEGTIDLGPQDSPTIYVAGNNPAVWGIPSRPIGSVFRVSFTGYGPGQRIWVLIYHNPDPASHGFSSRYRSRVSLRTSGRGEALLTLPTGQGEPKGCYVFDTIPTARGVVLPERGNGFCIA